MKRLKKLFFSHQPQFLFLLILFVVLNSLSEMPYLNLLLGKTLIFFIWGLSFLYLFNPSYKISIASALIILCFLPIMVIVETEDLLRDFASLFFVLLTVGVTQGLIKAMREENENKN